MPTRYGFLDWYLQAKLKTEPKEAVRPKFLIVEDDEAILTSLVSDLRERSYQADGVNDPRELNRVLDYCDPNVWLVDYFLSRHQTGLDLKTERLGSSAFILMSAYPQARVMAGKLGVAYLEKPFSVDQLLELTLTKL